MAGVHLATFVVSALALLLTPGPAVLYIVARSVERGPKGGMLAALGIVLASLSYLALAVLGLSALLVTFPSAFTAIKYLGAAYLVYLGIAKFRDRSNGEVVDEKPGRSNFSALFWQGFTVQILNPKVIFFFLAFLPQFVDLGGRKVGPQILGLGLLFIGMGFSTDSIYALLAGHFGQKLKQVQKVSAIQKYFSAAVYFTLGVLAAARG